MNFDDVSWLSTDNSTHRKRSDLREKTLYSVPDTAQFTMMMPSILSDIYRSNMSFWCDLNST